MYMWPWCWEKPKAGGEGDDRAWDGWMASLTQWIWVWASCRSWWWTGRPGLLQFHGVAKSQTWLSDWTELNWGNTVLLTSALEEAWKSISLLASVSSVCPGFFCSRESHLFLQCFMSFSYHLACFMVTFILRIKDIKSLFGHKVPHPIFKRGQEVANYICWKPPACQVLWHVDCLVWCSQKYFPDSSCLFIFREHFTVPCFVLKVLSVVQFNSISQPVIWWVLLVTLPVLGLWHISLLVLPLPPVWTTCLYASHYPLATLYLLLSSYHHLSLGKLTCAQVCY